jgi:PAT family beta-lactamase induction signal transducer AmpG
LDFWLKDAGLSNAAIGMFSLFHWPFTFKFIWGVFIENYDIPYLTKRIGRNRSWIIASHLVLMIGVIGMAYSDPGSSLPKLILFASLTALGDGCKGVVLYPYQIDGTTKNQLGYLASVVSFGHRIGMILIKVSTLHLAYFFSWKTAYLFSAFSICLLMIAVLFMESPEENAHSPNDKSIILFLADSFRKSLATQLKKLINRKEGLCILCVLTLYKSADFMMQKMTRLFLIEIGFSKVEIANTVQFWGSISVIIGGLISGYCIKKMGILNAMIYFGLLHAISFSSYMLLVKIGAISWSLWFITFCEAFTGGCVTTAFLSFLYTICKTGSLYAFLWALHDLGGMFFMGVSGALVDKIGWSSYFTLIPSAYVIILMILRIFLCKYRPLEESCCRWMQIT